ncbi:MAG: PEP-CTERM sorting domain-containing protein [Proteobacteria bacterium]|nr:PEP-CTERM sorting domain-containing protein [Pseudomonadota bacterium]
MVRYVDDGPDTWTVRSVNNPDQPVPEPTTILLMGGGLALLIGFRRRKIG